MKEITSEEIKQLIGQTLGKCKIVEFLGQGQIGAVFRGHHEALDREVAVKLLFPSCYNEEYFSVHAKKIVGLEHQNIIVIYDISFSETLGLTYLVEQWIYGTPLDAILREKKTLGLERSIPIMLSIADTLSYAHEQGIVHGNLAASNIVEIEQGQIKIKDFGLLPIHTSNEGDRISGPLGYMAPEQYAGESAQPTSDVYNLGCLFYQLLTASLPYASDHEKISPECALPQLPPDIPDAVAECIHTMLAPSPQNRFQNGKELLTHLQSLTVEVNKIRCPQCGKNNTVKEIFRCKKCGMQDLCFAHFDPEKGCCNRCSESEVIRGISSPVETGWEGLVKELRQIANDNKLGVLVFGEGEKKSALNLESSQIELCLDMPLSVVEKEYALSSVSDDDLPVQIVHAYLSRMLTRGRIVFEFWENESVERILPDHTTRIPLETSPSGFVISFSQIVQMFRALMNPGGLLIQGEKPVFVWFSGNGIILGKVSRDSETITPFATLDEGLAHLKPLLTPSCSQIRYQSVLPWGNADIQYNLSPIFLEILSGTKSWGSIGSFLPELHTLLPPTVNWEKPFGGSLPRLAQVIASNLCRGVDPEGLGNATGLLKSDSLLIFAAMIKDQIGEIGRSILKNTEEQKEKIGSKNLETIFLQMQELFPDMPEVFYLLAGLYKSIEQPQKAAHSIFRAGRLHRKMKNVGLALSTFEESAKLDPNPIEPRQELLELYEALDMRSELRETGIGLFLSLRKQKECLPQEMENVCLSLLKVDSGLAPCRKELARIYRKQGRSLEAIEQYEKLAELYEKAKNKEAMAIAMANVLDLDRKRQDIQKKLEVMGHRDWQKLVRVSSLGRPSRMATMAICLCGLVFLLLAVGREWSGISTLRSLEEKSQKSEEWNNIRQEAAELSSSFYISDVSEKAIALLQEIRQQEKKRKERQEREFETRIWKSFEEALDAGKIFQEWKRAHTLCMALENRFTHPKIKKEFEKMSLFFKEKWESWQKTVDSNAQRMISNAREMENRKEYEQAFHLYHKISKDPYLKDSPVAQQVLLPVRIETRPGGAECFIDQEPVGKTPVVFYHSPSQAFKKEIRVEKKGFVEKNRESVYHPSIEDCPWKISIEMEYRPLWTFFPYGEIRHPMFGETESEMIYFATSHGYVYGLSTKKEEKWLFKAPFPIELRGVAVGRKNVYTSTARGEVYAIDKQSGALQWKADLGSTVLAPAVALNDGLCIATQEGLFFLEEQGKIRKKMGLIGECIQLVHDNHEIVFVSTNKSIVYALKNQERIWAKKMKGTIEAGPIVAGKNLYLATSEKRVYGFDFAGKRVLLESLESVPKKWGMVGNDEYLWIALKDSLLGLSLEQGKMVWKNRVKSAPSHILVAHDRILWMNRAGEASVIEGKSGKLEWTWNMGKTPSSPLSLKAIVLIAFDKGPLEAYLLDASPKSLSEK